MRLPNPTVTKLGRMFFFLMCNILKYNSDYLKYGEFSYNFIGIIYCTLLLLLLLLQIEYVYNISRDNFLGLLKKNCGKVNF